MPRHLQSDRWLFGVAVVLCLFGAVMVFSASAVTAREQFHSAYTFLLRQLVWLGIGLAGMFALMNFDYRRLRKPNVVFSGLFFVLLLLLAVFLFGPSHAAHRWINLGPAHIQASELAKLAVILYLAWFLERRMQVRQKIRGRAEAGVNDLRQSLLPAVGPVLLFAGLILLQPDMGTAFEICLIALAMLFVAGLSWRYLAIAGVAAVPVIVGLILSAPYRYNRLLAFIHPEADPQGHGFQLLQSLIAVGSGGFTGVGLMESRQKLFYLPEAHTDFIFAVICEELGFIGAIAILALFAAYGWRGLRASLGAPDNFGRLLAAGITAMVVSQAFLNIGVVLGMLPTKGLPLPLVSYGGSSLLIMLLATGVLLNISQQAAE